MAGDWIKMRVGLRSHPKVVRIVSALRTDRLRVVGALYAVWSVFDAHSTDGKLPGYSLEMMDAEIGWPGFSEAMQGVQWLQPDGDCGLVMPEFSTHNGVSAKRRAEDALRKQLAREAAKKASAECPQPVRKSTDKKRTREEKRRVTSSSLRSEEEARVSLGVEAQTWTDFIAMRVKIRKPATERAKTLVLKELAKLKAAGADPNAILEQSIRNSWQDVFPIREQKETKGGQSPVNGAAFWKFGSEPNHVLKQAAEAIGIERWKAGETLGQFRKRIIDAGGEEKLRPPRRAA